VKEMVRKLEVSRENAVYLILAQFLLSKIEVRGR